MYNIPVPVKKPFDMAMCLSLSRRRFDYYVRSSEVVVAKIHCGYIGICAQITWEI